MIFFFEKIPSIFDIENWLWKYDFSTFWRTIIHRMIVLKKFPLSMLILGQKSCILGPTIFKIPQPNWHYYTVYTTFDNFRFVSTEGWLWFPSKPGFTVELSEKTYFLVLSTIKTSLMKWLKVLHWNQTLNNGRMETRLRLAKEACHWVEDRSR